MNRQILPPLLVMCLAGLTMAGEPAEIVGDPSAQDFARDSATPGVVQNSPIFTPGVAKVAFSSRTTTELRSYCSRPMHPFY